MYLCVALRVRNGHPAQENAHDSILRPVVDDVPRSDCGRRPELGVVSDVGLRGIAFADADGGAPEATAFGSDPNGIGGTAAD